MDEHLVRKSVDEANRAFAAAAGRKEYAGIAAPYTEDAVVLPPDGPIVTGRKACGLLARGGNGLSGITLRTVDLQVDGITACEVGEAELMLGSAAATVKYVVVWKRGGGGPWLKISPASCDRPVAGSPDSRGRDQRQEHVVMRERHALDSLSKSSSF
jgi:ketosteroid isomerase-like protein